jgi:Secretion system C-terminal sorting domain
VKRIILTYITIFVGLISIGQASAQSGSTQSRLNTGQKKDLSKLKLGTSSVLRFTNTRTNVKIQPSSAINAFYRSLMLGATANANTTRSSTSNESTNINTTDSRSRIAASADVNKAEDVMFVNEKIRVNNVYPNPANDYAEIEYQINGNVADAKITVISSIFSTLSELPLDKADKKIRINTQQLASGVYFYQLMVDGKKVATKKLLVRH